MLNKILIATTNKHKQEKLKWIIDSYFSRVDSVNDLKESIEVEEEGHSFKENAVIKAKEYSRIYSGYVIASDGGLSIPSLGKDWDGLRTKRFAGEGATDIERINLLLQMMNDKNGDSREMIWNEAVAIAKDGKVLFSKQVTGIRGVLEEKFNPKFYKEGIWVCSVWFFPQFNKNFFELNAEELEMVEVSWQKLRKLTQEFLKTLSK